MTEAQAAEIIARLDALNTVLSIVAGTFMGVVLCAGVEYFRRTR